MSKTLTPTADVAKTQLPATTDADTVNADILNSIFSQSNLNFIFLFFDNFATRMGTAAFNRQLASGRISQTSTSVNPRQLITSVGAVSRINESRSPWLLAFNLYIFLFKCSVELR